MNRLLPVKWDTLERIFESEGFLFQRQRGSHRAYVKPGAVRPIIIPEYAEISVPIIQGLLRTAGLSRERYLELVAQMG